MFFESDKDDFSKILLYIISFMLLFTCGFYLGRRTTELETKTVVEYVQGETITDTVYFEKPYMVIEPIDTLDILKGCIADGKFFDLFPEKVRDSIVYVTKEDTTKIMRDWATVRKYGGVLFNNEFDGKFSYEATVQYNELGKLEYEFTPIRQTVTTNTIKVKKYSPFIGFGVYTDANIVGNIGLFVDDSWGISINGRYNVNYSTTNEGVKYSIGLMAYKKF